MKTFYKVIDNKAQVGSGTPPDNTWVVYEVGQEPKELLDLLEVEREEQEEQALKLEQSKARDEAMLAGDVYSLNNIDYKISFTKDDGDGLVQVKSAFELGLTNTTIHFENGTNMQISSSEFTAFASWFVTKRNEFFI